MENFCEYKLNALLITEMWLLNTDEDEFHKDNHEIFITNSIFIDNLIELLTKVVSNHSNLIIIGNINIHLNELEYTDEKSLCNILEAFNITQHIKFPITIWATP